MKILVIQHEFTHRDHAKHVSFWAHFGLARALRDHGHNVTIVMARDFERFYPDLTRYSFEVCIINDVVHGFGGYSPSMTPSQIPKIKAIAGTLIGVMMESLFGYRNISGQLETFASERLRKLGELFDKFDGFMLADENDTNYLPQRPSILHSPFVFDNHMIDQVSLEVARYRKTVFIGEVNLHRAPWIRRLSTRQDFALAKIGDEDKRFWDHYIFAISNFRSIDFQMYRAHIEFLVDAREFAHVHYLRSISRFTSLLHLPTYFMGFHDRTLNALLAGIVPIIPISDLNKNHGFEHKANCLFFDPNDPESLTHVMSEVNSVDTVGSFIVKNGRNLLRERFSTSLFVKRFETLFNS